MAEQLGSLARTHTCGALRATDVGARRRAARLGASRPRPRRAALPRRARPPRPHPGDRRRTTRRCSSGPSGCASEFVVGVHRRGRAPLARHRERQRADRRGRGAGRARLRVLNEAKTPPFSIAEDQNVSEETRLRYRYLDLRRPQLQRNIGLRHRITMAIRQLLRRAGLLRDRDADPHQVDARGRARLPGAEPRPPGRVLRAAAVAADLQADPDDRRLRPLRADRPLLPRRGAARRSAARVHPGRPRDGVRHAAAGVRDRRGRPGRVLPRDRRRDRRPFRRMPYAEAIAKYGSDKPDLRFGLEIQDFGALSSPTRRSASSARRSSTAARCAASSSPGPAATRAANSTSWSIRPSSWARAGPGLGALHRRRRAVLGQGDRRRRHATRVLDARRAPRPATWSCWRRARPTPSRRCSDSCGCRWPRQAQPRSRRRAGSCSGSPTSRSSTGTPTRSAGTR